MLLYLEQNEVPAVLLSIDFEKCFDSISHQALVESLRYFNVGEYFISWVKMMYKDFEFCVMNNGYHSLYYKQGKGVHQGSALSGPLFLFTAEILAHRIQNNSKILGIKVGNTCETISQYADDTNIWSLYNETSINAIIDEFESLYVNTGLKVNFEKSTIYRVGAIRKSNYKLNLKRDFKWSSQRIDTLGLIIALDNLDDVEADNYDKMLKKPMMYVTVGKIVMSHC